MKITSTMTIDGITFTFNNNNFFIHNNTSRVAAMGSDGEEYYLAWPIANENAELDSKMFCAYRDEDCVVIPA